MEKYGKRHTKRFKRLVLMWNEELKLLDESYSVPDIQDFFEYIKKKKWRKD